MTFIAQPPKLFTVRIASLTLSSEGICVTNALEINKIYSSTRANC